MKKSDYAKVYALYHTKPSFPLSREYALKIDSKQYWQSEIIVNLLKVGQGVTNSEVVRYNDCYYISFNRKALLTKAREIKQQWIEEQKAVLDEIEAIKI